MIKNILIIGGSGSLGRNLINSLYSHNKNICVIARSEYRLTFLKKNFPNIISFMLDISNIQNIHKIQNIIIKHEIDTIINCAAMKHVNLCEENIIETLNTNVLFCQELVYLTKKLNIKYLINVSTDKANNPFNVYGMSKYMMEKIILDNGYKLFKGVNFFWSDGSVLDIWYKQYLLKKELTVTNLESFRYYNLLDTVSKTILNNIDNEKKIIMTPFVIKFHLVIYYLHLPNILIIIIIK